MLHPRNGGAPLIHPLIRNLAQHDQLSEEERQVLLGAIARDRLVGPNEDIISEGDRPWGSTILVEGFAARYKVQAEGVRRISAIHVPGDFVDLHSFLLRKMDHGVLALTACRLSAVPHDNLDRITREHPHLTRILWLSTVIDGAVHREWLVQMAGGQAYRRTAHLICELFVRLRAVELTDDCCFAFPLTQTDFGDMVGITNVHMNRTLMELRSDGLVTWKGGTVTIHDWDRLKQTAHFDPDYLNLPSERQ